MNTWKLITGVVLILLVGILFGSVGTWILIKPPRPPGPMDHRSRSAEAADRLAKDLDLSEGQKAAVEKIMQQMSEKLHERFLQHKPELDKILDDGFARIKEQLNNEQKKKFDDLRKRFGQFRGGPPPGGPGGPPPGGGPPFLPPLPPSR